MSVAVRVAVAELIARSQISPLLQGHPSYFQLALLVAGVRQEEAEEQEMTLGSTEPASLHHRSERRLVSVVSVALPLTLGEAVVRQRAE